MTAKIFLVEPIDEKKYKKRIVFADSQKDARTAAASLNNDEEKFDVNSSLYADHNLSTCIQIDPEIIKEDAGEDKVQVSYNEVIYDLYKNIAQDVITEEFY